MSILSSLLESLQGLVLFFLTAEGMWVLAILIWTARFIWFVQRAFRVGLNQGLLRLVADGPSWWRGFSFFFDVFVTIFMAGAFRLVIGVRAGSMAGALAGLVLSVLVCGLPYQAKIARRRGAPSTS